MKYLSQFYRKISILRDERKLSVEDIAEITEVDESVVRGWEHIQKDVRCYPTLDNLIDLCLKFDLPLEHFLDLEEVVLDKQPELPGLRFIEEGDLSKSLETLQYELERLIPTEQEMELLRRFRRSDEENQKLIIQLMSQ